MTNLKPIFLLIFIVIISACEKHEGVYYAKQKCEITLDGKTYIDQPVFSLMSSSLTPGFRTQSYWYHDENGATVKWPDTYVSFTTFCAPQRGEEWEIMIEAAIINSDIAALVGEPIEFRLDKFQNDSDYEAYREYCIFNGLNYAIISFRNADIATFIDSGTLTISDMTNDNNPRDCTGNFEFNFVIDGEQHTVTGKFKGVPYYNY